MPTRPPRACSGCGAPVTGRCTTCAPTAWARKPASWTGGSTRAWRRFRASWLADHPMCAGWPNGTCHALAAEVDHIEQLTNFTPDLREAARFDPRNVQSLCTPCHRKKTAEESARARRIRRAQETTGHLW